MALVHDNFRCQILGSSTKRVTAVINFLRKTEISDSHVSVCADEQVLRLEVTVSDLSIV